MRFGFRVSWNALVIAGFAAGGALQACGEVRRDYGAGGAGGDDVGASGHPHAASASGGAEDETGGRAPGGTTLGGYAPTAGAGASEPQTGGEPGSSDGGAVNEPCTDAELCTPAKPRLLAPHSTGRVTSRRPTFKWSAAERATSYQVELCADRRCSTVLEAMDVRTPSATPSAPLPKSSVVFWRVTAVSGTFRRTSVTWELFTGALGVSPDTSWLGPPDFDLDGRLDVALGSAAGQAYTMLNVAPTGLPATNPSQTIGGIDGFGRATANAGDVNGDGYGDLIVGAFSSGRAGVLLGGDDGVAQAPQLIGSGADDDGSSVAGLGDVNQDGYADVALGDETTSALYLGSAEGVQTSVSGPLLAGGVVAGAGDTNGDGYPDAIVCSRFSKTATVYLGSSAGLGSPITLVAPLDETTFGETCTTAGDTNGDGYADVIVSTQSGAMAYIFYGSPNGSLQSGPSGLTGAKGGGFGVITATATAGDVNADGYADVIVGGYNGNVVRVYHGGQAGVSTTAATTFTDLPSGADGGYGHSVASVGDANGDGFDDIAVSSMYCSGFDVYVYPGSAAGVKTASPLRTWPTPTGSQCYGIIAR